MNKIVEIMLSSVRAQVCGAESTQYGELSAEEMRSLYSLSKAHDIAHLVASELEKQGLLKNGDEISEKFRKQQMIAIFRCERICFELEEICTLFEQNKIFHLPLKGSVLRELYPEPWMRTSADIDILIHKDAFDFAVQCLTEALGYTREPGGTTCDVSFFSPSGVHLELHFGAMEEDCAVNATEVLENVWDYCSAKQGCEYRMEMCEAMFYFYHIAHMAKHFEHGGCGVRFFLDTWILNHGAKFDKDKRDELLSKGGLTSFSVAAKQLADVWFGGAEHSDISAKIEPYVLGGGIYGTLLNSVVTSRVRNDGKLRYAMRRIFLPYKALKRYYPYLEGRKWLLPFYEVRRWFRIIFKGNTKRSIDELKYNASIDEEHKRNVEDMLKQLELV